MAISISGTTLTFNDNTTQTTAATGTVSSVATGNGLSGGTITTSGTLTIACPGFNTVGSYVYAVYYRNSSANVSSGSNYSAGAGTGQISSTCYREDETGWNASNNLSGSWKWMAAGSVNGDREIGIACRVS